MENFSLKYGKNEVAIAIDGARSVQTLTENPMNTIEDIHAAFLKAITEDTIESPALKQLVASDDKITIIISDMTRFWMHQDIICEELVRYLNEAIGIPFEHIVVLIGLGTHHKNTPADQKVLTGAYVYDHVAAVVDHDCDAPDLVDIELQLSNRRISRAKFGQGIERLLFGLSKKVLLANNLGLLYETIQASVSRSIMTSWLGIFAYTLQIYFDFSGYSDMAIGMGKMLGFTFPENFNFPYISDSITEFWRRWHMTLSGWFREYVYIPLGGNRVSKARHILNLLIVWMLTGFWHGAAWNFILWGLYYGILLILEKYIFSSLLKKLPKAARHIYTMRLVMIGWVLFSNTDFGSMRTYVGALFGIGTKGFLDLAFFYYIRNNLIILIMGVLCATPIIRNYIVRCSRKKPAVTSAVLLLLGILSIAFLVYGTYNPFLYFRF